MHGFPHAVKDLANVIGLKTTMGFFRPPFDVPAASSDSLAVERIRAVGAIFIGKTNTPEFGLGSHTYNNVFGTTLNATDQTGRPAAAAAALRSRWRADAPGRRRQRLLRLAAQPAGWNNVLGLRPSFGRGARPQHRRLRPAIRGGGPDRGSTQPILRCCCKRSRL
jgi:amidase